MWTLTHVTSDPLCCKWPLTPHVVEGDTEDMSEEDTLDDEFRHHKRNYYMTKMDYEKVTP